MLDGPQPLLRRLPVYLLLDTSSSMAGEPIEAVRQALRLLLSDLQTDPQALETVWVSAIAFDSEARQVVPLVPLEHFEPPDLQAGHGGCALGAALRLLTASIGREVRRPGPGGERGDWEPVVLIVADGGPTDDWEAAADELRRGRAGSITGCAAGPGAEAVLGRITETVVRLQDVSPGWFGSLIMKRAPFWSGVGVTGMGDAPERRESPTEGQHAMAEAVESYARRLPVYLLLDASGSMAGEPIVALEMGIKALLSDLSQDPQAIETVALSVITFDSTAQQIVPLTDVADFQPPQLEADGTTAFGEAITLLEERIKAEVRKASDTCKGDWKPLVFVFTDGTPNDEWQPPVDSLRSQELATVIACGAGPEVDRAVLERIGDKVIPLDTAAPGTLGAFMKWVSQSVTSATRSVGVGVAAEEALPDLPEDLGIHLVP